MLKNEKMPTYISIILVPTLPNQLDLYTNWITS